MKTVVGAFFTAALLLANAASAAPELADGDPFRPSECTYSKYAELLYCEREIAPVIYTIPTVYTVPDPRCTGEGETGQRVFQQDDTYVETWVTYAIYAHHSPRPKYEIAGNETMTSVELVSSATTDLGCEAVPS